MKDLSYYTVYNQDGLYMGSHQDKDWAEFARREYNGTIVVSPTPIEDTRYDEYYSGLSKRAAAHHVRVRKNSCIYAFCCIIIVSYTLVYKIVTEPFNIAVLIAFIFFGIIGCVFIYLLSYYEKRDV